MIKRLGQDLKSEFLSMILITLNGGTSMSRTIKSEHIIEILKDGNQGNIYRREARI
jgi:hypothetical protein